MRALLPARLAAVAVGVVVVGGVVALASSASAHVPFTHLLATVGRPQHAAPGTPAPTAFAASPDALSVVRRSNERERGGETERDREREND